MKQVWFYSLHFDLTKLNGSLQRSGKMGPVVIIFWAGLFGTELFFSGHLTTFVKFFEVIKWSVLLIAKKVVFQKLFFWLWLQGLKAIVFSVPCQEEALVSMVSFLFVPPPQVFKYSTSLERHKIFISGLPFSCTKEQLEGMFKEHGTVKDIRLVTNRSGKPKVKMKSSIVLES